jgi:hypothetical protein
MFSTSPRTSGGQAALSKVAFWKTAKNAVDGFSIYRSLLMRLSKLARPTLPISNSLSLQVAHGLITCRPQGEISCAEKR